jgi:hypothetical protein
MVRNLLSPRSVASGTAGRYFKSCSAAARSFGLSVCADTVEAVEARFASSDRCLHLDRRTSWAVSIRQWVTNLRLSPVTNTVATPPIFDSDEKRLAVAAAASVILSLPELQPDADPPCRFCTSIANVLRPLVQCIV